MRRSALVALVGLSSLGVAASAGEREWYFGVEGGVEFDGTYNEWHEDGLAILATAGRRITPHFSLEGEFGYRSTYDWLLDVSQTSVIVNAVYEAPLTEQISLSVGAGVGFDYIEIEYNGGGFLFSSIEGDLHSAAQLKLGLIFKVDEAIDVTANYRLMTALDNDVRGLDNATLTVGMRFSL
jgi:opacity protein-like surface antigen